MSPRFDNRDLVQRVARKLGPLADRVVFLGGAVTGLLVTDAGAAPPRPTFDVDVTIELASLADYARWRDDLCARGFSEDTRAGAPTCRWVADGLTVDIMPTEASFLGFTNRWYRLAVITPDRHVLPGGLAIRVVTAPCFLATKLEAFHGRGEGDYQASHDLEDLMAVVDGRQTIEPELAAAPEAVRLFVAAELRGLLNDRRFLDALPGFLPGDSGSQARVPLLSARLSRLAR